MEAFALLPYFLLCRVPEDVDTWRYGPEYTFVADANMTTLEGRSIIDFYVYQVHSTLKCRPKDRATLRCQFGPANIVIYRDTVDRHEDEDSWFHAPFEVKYDHRGVQSLLILREMAPWHLDMVQAFVGQLNFGFELMNKPDGAFRVTDSSYFGQCDSLVNISREIRGNEVPGNEDYEIQRVLMLGTDKMRGEVLTIGKERDLENCADKRDYVMSGEEKRMGTRMISSTSRITISDTDYDSYTENTVEIINMGITFSFFEKISMSLVSVLPAKEELEPFPNDTMTVSPYVYSKKQ